MAQHMRHLRRCLAILIFLPHIGPLCKQKTQRVQAATQNGIVKRAEAKIANSVNIRSSLKHFFDIATAIDKCS